MSLLHRARIFVGLYLFVIKKKKVKDFKCLSHGWRSTTVTLDMISFGCTFFLEKRRKIKHLQMFYELDGHDQASWNIQSNLLSWDLLSTSRNTSTNNEESSWQPSRGNWGKNGELWFSMDSSIWTFGINQSFINWPKLGDRGMFQGKSSLSSNSRMNVRNIIDRSPKCILHMLGEAHEGSRRICDGEWVS